MAVGTVLGGIGAIAGAGAGIAGLFGGGGGGGGGDAADAMVRSSWIQSQSAAAGREQMQNFYDQAVARMAPWIKAGTGAVDQYAGLLNLPGYDAIDPTKYLRSTPGYQWQMDQGTEALNRNAAKTGMLYSGPQAKSIQSYGQGLADQTYNKLMDRLYNLSGQGQSAAALTANQGIATGQNMANSLMAGGQAEGAGLVNAYNARQSAYGNQQNNLWGGLGALTRGITAAAPYVQNWWGGGNNGNSYGSSRYYGSGVTPAGYAENYYS